MATLRLAAAQKVFGDHAGVRALDEVSIEIVGGEYIAITGDSGSGKSTLLAVLGLLDEPSAGEYTIDGSPSRLLSSSERARVRSDHFAHVFQAFHLLERRPAVDSVGLPLLYRGLQLAEMRAASLAALDQLGLSKFAQVKGGLLSGGQRQRVAIGRALAAKAPVLLADEPTGNLDSANTSAVMDAMDQVHRSGTTVVVVTHSADVASRADRIIRMRDGTIEEDTTKSEPVSELVVPLAPAGRASTVRFVPMMRDVIDNLLSRPGRASGLVLAVAVAVGLVVATLGLSFSASQQVSDLFDVATSREVAIKKLVDATSPPLSSDQLARISRLNGVASVADVVASDGIVQRAQGQEMISAPWFHARGDLVNAGRVLLGDGANPWTGSLRPGTALIGEALATRLELAPVQTSPSVLVDGVPYAVVGLITDAPREAGWIGGVLTEPPSTPLVGLKDNTTLISTVSGAGQQVARELPLAVDPVAPESVSVSAPPDPTGMRGGIESSLQTTLIVLTLTALLGSLASMTLASVAAATERRAEFGLRRALGARSVHIVCMLGMEAALTGLVGALGGLLSGLVAVLAVTVSNRWTPVFDFRLAVLALVAGVLVSIIGSLAGAVRALRIQPSSALKPSH